MFWCSPWCAFIWFLLLKLFVQPQWSHWNKGICPCLGLETEQMKERAGLLYLVRFLLFAVNSSHVVLHAGVCDKGLWTTFNRTPEDQNSYKLQKKGSTLGSQKRMEQLTCVAFPRCGWAHVWWVGSGCRSSCCSSHRRRVSAVTAKRSTCEPQKQKQQKTKICRTFLQKPQRLTAPALTNPVCLQRWASSFHDLLNLALQSKKVQT